MNRYAAKILHLLHGNTLAAIVHGVELATALRDGALVDELLDGVEYDPDAAPHIWGSLTHLAPTRRAEGRVYPNKRFKPRRSGHTLKSDACFREQALMGLISRGPGRRAQALRSGIRAVVLGPYRAFDAPPEWDAALLDGLVNLESLVLWCEGPIHNIGRLATRLPRLRRLRVASDGHPVDIAGIGDAPALVDLELEGTLGSVEALRAARLRHLGLRDPRLQALDALDSLGSLETLELACAGVNLEPGPAARFASGRGGNPL